jgi:hypothetical protein
VKDFLHEATSEAFEFEFVKQEASVMLERVQLGILDFRKDFETGNYYEEEESFAWEGVSLLYGSVARTQEARTPAEKESRAITERPPHYWELYLVRELSAYAEEDSLPLTLCLIPNGLWRDIANALGDYLTSEDRRTLLELGSLNSRARANRATGLPPEDQLPESFEPPF